MNRRLALLSTTALTVIVVIMAYPTRGRLAAQLDPTQQKLTINAIVNPRLTLTAQVILEATNTVLAQATLNSGLNQTASLMAQTATLTPSLSPTISETPVPSSTPVIFTPTPIDMTDQYSTVLAAVNDFVSQTSEARTVVAGTSDFQQTVNSILVQTLGFTLTPTPTATSSNTPLPTVTPTASNTRSATLNPTEQQGTLVAAVKGFATQTSVAQTMDSGTAAFKTAVSNILMMTAGYSPTPVPTPTNRPTTPTPTLNSTRQYQTIVAAVKSGIVQTSGAQTATAGTAYFENTVNSILVQTVGYTATPLPSATLNPLQVQQTAAALVNLSLSQTPQARVAQSATAALQVTLNAIAAQNLTATGTTVYATLTHGLRPIDAANASKVKLLMTLKGQTDSVSGVAISPDGGRIASASLDGTVWLWDTQTGAALRKLSGLSKRLSVAFSPDGTRLAGAASDGTVRVWDAQSGEELFALKGHTKDVLSVTYSPNGKLIASGGSDKTVRIWDAQAGAPMLTLAGIHGAVSTVRFSPDGTRIAASVLDNTLDVWETSTGIPVFSVRATQALASLSFDRDGAIIAVGGNGGEIQIHSAKTGESFSTITGPTSPITSLAFNADSVCLAAGAKDGSIGLWNVKTGDKLAELTAHEGGVNSIAFSLDGTRLVSGGKDGLIRIWAVSEG